MVLTAIAKVYFTNLTSFFSRKNFHQKSSHFFTTWKFHNLDYFILSILYFTNLTSLFSQKNFHQKSSHFFTTWKFHNLDYFTLSIYSIIPIWPASFPGKKLPSKIVPFFHYMEISQSWLLYYWYTLSYQVDQLLFPEKTFHQKSSHFFTTWKFPNLDYFTIGILYYTNLTSFYSRKNFHQKSSHFFTTWFIIKIDHFWPC